MKENGSIQRTIQTKDAHIAMRAEEKGGGFRVTLFSFLFQLFLQQEKKRFRGGIGADIPRPIPSFSPALPGHRERLLTILQSTTGHPPVRTEVFDPTTSGAVT